jgi:quercetin dioxygenase-like cupin family protein
VAGLFSVITEAEQVDGRYTVLVGSIPPQGGPPPMHKHPFGESFYVLDGSFEFGTIGEQGVEIIRPKAGSIVNVPGNVPHTFRNVGTSVGTLLVVAEPTLVAFLREIAEFKTPEGQPDFARAAPVLEKYQMVFVESPNVR